jgi:hypothetical protein
LCALIEWCLDPTQPRTLIEPAPAHTAMPHEFATSVLRRRTPLDPSLVATLETLLERPLASRPLDPIARDERRSRRLLARLWEALGTRNLIPAAWTHDGLARFVAAAQTPSHAQWAVHTTPASLRALLALATDPGAIERSEALAHEAISRFEAVCVYPAASPPAVWYVLGDSASLEHGDMICVTDLRPGAALRTALDEALAHTRIDEGDAREALLRGMAHLDSHAEQVARAAARDLDDARRWRLACHADLRVPHCNERTLRCADARFSDLADPFAPLVELWSSGYGLGSVTADATVLLAPAIDDLTHDTSDRP